MSIKSSETFTSKQACLQSSSKQHTGSESHAPLQVVLGRWCRQEDVVVGLPYSGRTRPQLEGLVGNFINMLPIRTGLLEGASFEALLRGVQQSITDALSHAELPFNKLVEAMGVSRSAGRTPVFQAVVDVIEDASPEGASGLVRGPAEAPVSLFILHFGDEPSMQRLRKVLCLLAHTCHQSVLDPWVGVEVTDTDLLHTGLSRWNGLEFSPVLILRCTACMS